MPIYSGAHPQRISSLLDEHCAAGYTKFRNVHGAVLPTGFCF